MKNFYITALFLFQSVALLPALESSTKKIIHLHIEVEADDQYLLGGEITNTEVNVGIFKIENNDPILVIEYQQKNVLIKNIYQHISDILDDLKQHHNIIVTDACFAIPGIARGDLFLHPHLPWNTSDDKSLHSDKSQRGISKQHFLNNSNLQNVYFINDFQAVAIGTQLVDTASLIKLQQGNLHPKKPKLVIGAGNGLGASLLLWDNQLNRYVPSQLNYSFTEFGAQSDLELDFFNFMKNKTGNIAWGKVLGAGAGGIKLIYRFFDEYHSQKEVEHKKHQTEKFVDYENYLDIFKNINQSVRCKEAVNFFIDQYTRIIRNAAYAQAVYGGVYITNTVIQEFPELFNNTHFINKIVKLHDKVLDEGSRKYLESYLAEIPFYLVTDKKVQLYGAAALCIEPNLIRN